MNYQKITKTNYLSKQNNNYIQETNKNAMNETATYLKKNFKLKEPNISFRLKSRYNLIKEEKERVSSLKFLPHRFAQEKGTSKKKDSIYNELSNLFFKIKDLQNDSIFSTSIMQESLFAKRSNLPPIKKNSKELKKYSNQSSMYDKDFQAHSHKNVLFGIRSNIMNRAKNLSNNNVFLIFLNLVKRENF